MRCTVFGTGYLGATHAAGMAELGHDVVGVDIEDRFVAVARDAGVPVIRADMRTAVVRPSSFDAAFCLWGSFGYFDEEGNRRQSEALVDALVAGGRLLIDTLVADTLLPGFVPDAEWSVGDVGVREHRRYDADTKRVETTWTFTSEGTIATQATSVRIYAMEELTDLLAACGCTSFQAYDGELAPFGDTSDRLWLVATKG